MTDIEIPTAITMEQLYDMLVSVNAKLDSLMEFRSDLLTAMEEFKHHPMLKVLGGMLNRG